MTTRHIDMNAKHAPLLVDTLPLRRTLIGSGIEFHHVEAGEGPPLVFVHGVLGDWRTWAPQWSAFSPHFRTVSYSRRYSVPNRNETVPSPNHSAWVEAQDLSELLLAWDASPAVLVASSYGAFTALALAVQHPEQVRALALLEPPMLGWADFTEEGRQVRAAFDRDIRLPARAAFERGDDEQAVRLLTQGIVGANSLKQIAPEAMQRRLENRLSIRMLTLSTDEFPMLPPEAVRAVKAPTLLMAGANTPPIHDVVYRTLCRAMPQAEQRRIPDAGHGAARDNPTAFNRMVLDFLMRQGLCQDLDGQKLEEPRRAMVS